MKCMQANLYAILPPGIRTEVSRESLAGLQEIRLRVGRRVCLVTAAGLRETEPVVSAQDLTFCVNAASRYSPWNAATVKQGFLTAPGGHRIGLCGEWNGEGLRSVHSLCIRVAKDLPGIADGIPLDGSLLILGPPGSGKTTLLRDLIRRISCRVSISVVDERSELFPQSEGTLCFDPGPNTDVLSGCGKGAGIDMVLRAMGPQWIAMDEITGEADCAALIRAGWCGVGLAATAHAASVDDLRSRPIYRPLVQTGLFSRAVVLGRDKRWYLEEIMR